MTPIFALVFVLCAAPSFASDAVLAKISGPVFIRAEGSDKDLPAAGGEELLYGDSVKTGPGAIAHVLIGGRAAVLARENSSFRLAGDPQKTSVKFASGEFLIGLRKKLQPGESFSVFAPSSAVSVRGRSLLSGKTDGKKTSSYAVFGRTISVTGSGKTVLVHAGETTTVPFDEIPSPVRPSGLTAAALDGFRIDGSLQDLEPLVDLPKASPAAPAQ